MVGRLSLGVSGSVSLPVFVSPAPRPANPSKSHHPTNLYSAHAVLMSFVHICQDFAALRFVSLTVPGRPPGSQQAPW